MFPRSYATAAVIASIVIGLVGGIVVVREAPTLFADPGTKAIPRSTPEPTINEFAFPPTPEKVIAALHALGTRQTMVDVFPLPDFLQSTDIDPDSVHRVLTTGDGSELWIGRTATELCLLFSSTNPFPTDGISAGSSCQPPTEFAKTGIVLQEGNDRWTWDGKHFTTTIEAVGD
jgi:hypothetical protein